MLSNFITLTVLGEMAALKKEQCIHLEPQWLIRVIVTLNKSQFPWGQHGNSKEREIRNQIVASDGGCPLP